ncbi:MAG: hypothetical protein K5886_09400 [Lachnospiraceae bacterium]|nr:hypothetical protein [Lachnospiraceae bacterium]
MDKFDITMSKCDILIPRIEILVPTHACMDVGIRIYGLHPYEHGALQNSAGMRIREGLRKCAGTKQSVE